MGIVEKFGKYDRLAHPGFHFVVPCVEEIKGNVSLRVRQLIVETPAVTKDSVSVTTRVAVQYRVDTARSALMMRPTDGGGGGGGASELTAITATGKTELDVPLLGARVSTDSSVHAHDPEAPPDDPVLHAFYSLEDPDEQIRTMVANTVRSHVAELTLDETFAQQRSLTATMAPPVQLMVTAFGFVVTKVQLLDLQPSFDVKVACNGIMVARHRRAAEAQRAEGQKIGLIKSAEASAEAKRIAGVGTANERKAIFEGLYSGLDKDKQYWMPLLLLRFTDTLRDMAHAGATLMVPNDVAGMHEIRSAIKDVVRASYVQTMH